MCFYETNNIFISKTKQIYGKTLTVPENTSKIKAMLPWILFEILITSVVIHKQRFLHENEIAQYRQNCKYQDVNQSHFRKPIQASTNFMKNNYPTPAYTFLMVCSILSYFLRLNCYNFRIALTKSVKLHFWKFHYSLAKAFKEITQKLFEICLTPWKNN